MFVKLKQVWQTGTGQDRVEHSRPVLVNTDRIEWVHELDLAGWFSLEFTGEGESALIVEAPTLGDLQYRLTGVESL